MTGLGLIAGLFPRDYSIRQWLMIGVASVAMIDLGFVLFEPQLDWYVGLSGVLHGALAAGAVSWWARESRPFAVALALILIGKLAWEQWRGALPLSGDCQRIRKYLAPADERAFALAVRLGHPADDFLDFIRRLAKRVKQSSAS